MGLLSQAMKDLGIETIITPNHRTARNGGSFQECSVTASPGLGYEIVTKRYGRYCTIRDNENAPPTSVAGRKWVQIFRTPDNTE